MYIRTLESFKGENCVQVFLHYNDASGTNATRNTYDSRPFLGLPTDFGSYNERKSIVQYTLLYNQGKIFESKKKKIEELFNIFPDKKIENQI